MGTLERPPAQADSRIAPILALAGVVSVTAAVSICGCAADAQSPQARSPRFVASQVIVKFRDGTEAADVVTRAIAGELEKEPDLLACVRDLGERLSIPLIPRQVTSGHEVLASIDLPRFVDQILGALRSLEPISEAEEADDPGAESSLAFRLRFEQGSGEAAAVARAWRAGGEGDGGVDEIEASLGRQLDLPLASRLAGERDLRVEVNLHEVTEAVAARLGELDEVEYAELNQILEFMD